MRPTIDTRPPQIRNVPMRPRAWNDLLETDGIIAIQSDEGTLALVPRDGQFEMFWSFDGIEPMRQQFPDMWEDLRPDVTQDDADHIVLNLVEVHGKEWLEPLLRDADFEFFAEWMQLTHPALDPEAVPEFPEDVTMRRAQDDDLPAIREIWSTAYGDYADGPRTVEARLERASWVGVLEAENGIVAFAANGDVHVAEGEVLAAAVSPDARGHGYGALVLSAAAFQLSTQDARLANIIVRPDIPQALRTATSAGFRPGRGGLEYRRTTDEDAIAAAREARRQTGVKARFGGWR